MAKQAKMPSASVMASLAVAMAAAQQIAADNADLLQTIKEQAAKQVEAKNVADDASTGKKSLWDNVINLAEQCATVEASSREIVFSIVCKDILESETANTAKMYASTAKRVLTVLHTEQGKEWDELRTATYADIQKMLKPDANPEFTSRLAEMTKRLKYVGRKGIKADTLALLDLLEESVNEAYNPLKAASDAKSAAVKAAKELEANRQESPSEGATTETVAQRDVA